MPELTVYRIGNAISILFNEKDYIRPVQGLPIALLSKAIVWCLLPFLPIVSPAAISIYMISYFGVVILSASLAIFMAWPKLSEPQRVGILLLFACPWLLGGPSFLLISEPDYWAGEWSYLIISSCLLATYRMPPWLVGVWLAIGVGMKITLLGIAPLFILTSDRSPRALIIMCLSFIAAFVLIDLVYMGGVRSGIRLLIFQTNFFAHPNNSAMWPNVFSVILSRHFLVALDLACVIALLTSPAPILQRMACAAWLCGFTYLVWRRPHDTSIASAATAVTFVTIYLARTWYPLAAVASLLLIGAASDGFERTKWIGDILRNGHALPSEAPQIPQITGMFYQPDNYWNAGLAVQAFGYNGELGYYYSVANNPDGTPRYIEGGRAFQTLFPGIVMIADSPSWLSVAEVALRAHVPIWWTRQDPVQPNSTPGSLDRLNAMIERTGAKVETFPIITDGHPWLLQKAVLEQRE